MKECALKVRCSRDTPARYKCSSQMKTVLGEAYISPDFSVAATFLKVLRHYFLLSEEKLQNSWVTFLVLNLL